MRLQLMKTTFGPVTM